MRGQKLLAGVDEAGRGAWAGPLVAAAVILPQRYSFQPKDSKKLSATQRERLFVPITRGAIAWQAIIIEQAEIDQYGIQAANLKALRLSLEQLSIAPDNALVDGFVIKPKNTLAKKVIRGDEKIPAIAAASIVAKVIRDQLMLGHHRLLPQWNFAQHKGYGTPDHQERLGEHGLSPIHRRSFTPMNGM